MAARVRHAGAIFLGRHTPEAIGDYVAGPNHVLPTARTARFASGLGGLDFMKRTTLSAARPRASPRSVRPRQPCRAPRGLTPTRARSSVRLAAADAGMSGAGRRADRRHPPRSREHRALEPRGRARAPGRHVRPVGAQLVRAGGRLCRPVPVALSLREARLVFVVDDQAGAEGCQVGCDAAFRRLIKDYFRSATAISRRSARASPSRIEAIDMGARAARRRRGKARRRARRQAQVDDETARRLFTLVCVLHVRG